MMLNPITDINIVRKINALFKKELSKVNRSSTFSIYFKESK